MKPSDRLECLVAARSLRRGGTTEEAITLTQNMCAWVEAQDDADAAIAVVRLLGSDAASPLKGDGPLRALDNLYRFATNQTEEVGNSALYLLSDMGRAVTGETHHVDSGYHVVGMKAVDAPDISKPQE